MLNDRLRRTGKDKLGWPMCGEIDIMEQVGAKPEDIHFSLHCEKYNWMKPEQRTKVVQVKDPDAYHRFGLAWTAKSITFFLDGVPMYKVEKTEDSLEAWPFDDPYYIILNLAIGGNMGGAIDDSIFPTRVYVKSVKVYQ
jgi:beta-glucanase (GH16 family)